MPIASRQTLTQEQQRTIREAAEHVCRGNRLPPEDCIKAVHQAFESSTLDFRSVYTRFVWLLQTDKPTGIRLFSHCPEMTWEQLAETIVYPRDAVLRIVEKKTNVPLETLRQIYTHIREKTGHDETTAIDDLTEERILQEIKWWLVDLEFPDYYFKTTGAREMANQIMTNRFYELQGTDSEAYSRMKISYSSPQGTSIHWVHAGRGLEVEGDVERLYYASRRMYNIETYSPTPDLLLYIIDSCEDDGKSTAFEKVAPRSLLNRSDTAAQLRYGHLRERVIAKGDIQIDRSHKVETGENRVMIGFPMGTINHFLANISRVMVRNRVPVTRKYAVIFGGSKPVVITSLYAKTEFPDDLLEQLVNVSLYPNNRLSAHVEGNVITPVEANFANAVILFVHQFITSADPNIALLQQRFHRDLELTNILRNIQTRIDRDTYTHAVILEAFYQRPDVVHGLFEIFTARFHPRLKKPTGEIEELIGRFQAGITATVLNSIETAIYSWGLDFIGCIERTNFFLPTRIAVSFRLASDFFKRMGYEALPHGVFYVVGRAFHGYHVRFKDIARGGVRLIGSETYDDYVKNRDYLFEECYNLASTQNKKNKDIPEGGAKGVILLNADVQRSEGEPAFKKYVNALLDLTLPANREHIANYHEEILFLGPDEGTAELADWASEHAREIGYRYWKAFTTGKQARMGGISHKEYGMTTQGIRRYVLGLLREHGDREEEISKVQTGGPDGDLGSNEILMSSDRTIALIDAGGVLYDPQGLDRRELTKLTELGANSSAFDASRLSRGGFKITTKDRNAQLPDGTSVVSGIAFRNNFHFDKRLKADLFLPCGGRPKSINITNWESLLDAKGAPIFRWIVEGANLFITQDARLKLEDRGVVLFKDSSTNKGGVISSSFEVLAALSLTDDEYQEWMIVQDKQLPEFRKKYVAQVIDTIKRKADLEFDLLWRTREQAGGYLSEISERISEEINEITEAIEHSALFDNERLRENVLAMHIPDILLKTVGLATLTERIPLNYQRAIFARTIASNFIYAYGIEPGFENYREYIETLGH